MCCEPRPGISHARNTGVARGAGRYLVFLDDDEEPVPRVARRLHRDDAGIGRRPRGRPGLSALPGNDAGADAYRRRKYTRDACVPTGTRLQRWAGIGNTILDKARCFAGDEPFDPALGLTGGEDTVFLHQLMRSGRKLVWCAEAAVNETVPADRLDPNYLLRRAFRGGQSATFVCTIVSPPQPARALRMMLGRWRAARAVRLRRRRDAAAAARQLATPDG